jgi:Metal-dependent hydrolases of the beta-lactamase superfamily I
MTRITFLGTGGGRHATIYQTRSTGGFILDSGRRVHVDPGPGALTNMKHCKLDPADTDAILISHCHPDHYSDAEVLIEGMCKGGAERRGGLIASESVLNGFGGIGPCISPYHQKYPKCTRTVVPGDSFTVGALGIDVTHSDHNDISTVGFRFNTEHGVVSYVSDTSLSKGITEQYVGSRVLMLPITTPNDRRIKGHMCTDDAIDFVNAVRPELTLFLHMGIYVIKLGPEEQAKKVAEATGYKVVAADDLMVVDIDDQITIR